MPFIHGRKLSDAPKVWQEVKIALSGKAPATINHKGRIEALAQACKRPVR